jgi:hypothetical protein
MNMARDEAFPASASRFLPKGLRCFKSLSNIAQCDGLFQDLEGNSKR